MQSFLSICLLACVLGGDAVGIQSALEPTLGPEHLGAPCQQPQQCHCLKERARCLLLL